MAASLVEIMKLVDMASKPNQELFLNTIEQFLNDIDEVKVKVLPNVC